MTDINDPDRPGESENRIEAAVPAVGSVETRVAADTDVAAGKVESLFGIEAIKAPIDRQVVQDAWAYLQSSGEKSLADLKNHETHVGRVVQDYQMTGEVPDVVDKVYERLELRMRQQHLVNAREELTKPAPDLMKILESLRGASSNVAAMPAEVGEEIARLREEIESRGLRSETYDRMVELSSVVGEVLTHLASQKNIMAVETTVAALKSGDTRYVKTARDIAVKLPAYDVKNGAESRAALKTLAERITEIARQL